MRKVRKSRTDYLFFLQGEGDGLVILKGFEGMFAHPLNGLKGLDASIFLSAHFRGESPRGLDQFCPVTDCTNFNRYASAAHMEKYHY